MNRMPKIISLSMARLVGQPLRRSSGDGAGGSQLQYGVYHSYLEAARSISMNEIPKATLPYAEGAAKYNAKYNMVLGAGVVSFIISVVLIGASGFFSVPRHRPLKNTPEGLEFLNHPHEGYHSVGGSGKAASSAKGSGAKKKKSE